MMAARRRRIDLLIALGLLIGSGIWGTHFWYEWRAQGREPEFYQVYYEPAVMVACGRGFIASLAPPPALTDFVNRRRDRLECSELPQDLALSRDAVMTGAWAYLQYTVGWFWRVAGISWSGLGPLFGALFGITIAIVYGLARLGMRRSVALLAAIAFATSPLHLASLPHLRDYAKAPFTLALFLLLGTIVVKPARWSSTVPLAAACGLVLGVGYGFRTDLLANIPLAVAGIVIFSGPAPHRQLVIKLVSAVVVVVAFVAASWPILSSVSAKGGCQWHVALLGMQSPFEEALHLESPPYDFGYRYEDGYVIRGVQGFAHRTQPEAVTPIYCSPEYDRQSGRLLTAIVATFPADFVARAYASIRQILELPFRREAINAAMGWGAAVTGVALSLASGASVRLGLFLVFFVLYVGGYPAVQFQDRHYFHLEFIGWWTLGFVVDRGWSYMTTRDVNISAPETWRVFATNVAVVALSVAVAVIGLLLVMRWYQHREARALFESYLAAPRSVLPPQGALPATNGIWPQVVDVVLDEASCGPRPAVTFQYNPADRDGDFTRTITIDNAALARGPTHIILPVFESYTGLALSDTSPGCVVAVYRFDRVEAFPLLLSVTLQPEWQRRPLFARLQF